MQKIVLIAACTAMAAALNAQNQSFEKYEQAIPGSAVSLKWFPLKPVVLKWVASLLSKLTNNPNTK
ncbi:hypothetical protein [Niabella hibiscisoli]|uniref:hypothetical protein n=1 Tax=Niabella hibiscisoli TaxID=1825928 RepID=UPI001F0EDD9D|nr:hypothetical protein [Niabella hibiscisoli]MCH5717169.1 hypothetical protein [Niabella hibiscisoli]